MGFRWHHDSGVNKAASLLLTSYARVRNTKDMADLPGDTLSPPVNSHLTCNIYDKACMYVSCPTYNRVLVCVTRHT